MHALKQAVVDMKVLLASMLFQQIEQALPFFFQYVEEMNPKPDKAILFNFAPEQKFDAEKIKHIFHVEKKQIEKDFAKQLCETRNNVLQLALKEGFDAVIFLQPNIFPPPDLISRLAQAKKEIIAPAFFFTHDNMVFSNTVTIYAEKDNHKITPLLFYDLLPSGVKKVDSVSMQAVFLAKSFFEKLEFAPSKDQVEEMLFLAEKAKECGKEIFVDSSTVCARLSQTQLFSHYYFKAQKNSFDKQGI